jgi:hypothetical protein
VGDCTEGGKETAGYRAGWKKEVGLKKNGKKEEIRAVDIGEGGLHSAIPCFLVDGVIWERNCVWVLLIDLGVLGMVGYLHLCPDNAGTHCGWCRT